MSELPELTDGVIDLVARLAAALARQLAVPSAARQDPPAETMPYSVHISNPSAVGKLGEQMVEVLRAGPLSAEDIARRLGMHVETVEAELQRLTGYCFVPVQAWTLCATFGVASTHAAPAPAAQPQASAERRTESKPKRKQAEPKLSDAELARRIQAAKEGRLDEMDASGK